MDNQDYLHAIPSVVSGNEIPLGMGMAFAKDLSALSKFASLTVQEQQSIIARAQNVTSKEEMAALVRSI